MNCQTKGLDDQNVHVHLQAQFRQGDLMKALYSLGQAISINSNNPIPRFHRAKVLEALGRQEVSEFLENE